MYFWKCWRDSRTYFFVFVISGLLAMPIAVSVMARGSISDAGMIGAIFATVAEIGLIAAFGLAAQMANEEFGDKSIHFLFAKPRSRTYFVWVAWCVGCVELLVVMTLNLIVGWIVLTQYGKFPAGRVFGDLIASKNLLATLVSCFFIYSFTYMLTAILRRGFAGLGSALLLSIGARALVIVLRVRWQIRLPLPPDTIGNLPLFVSHALWIVLALALVAAAQWRFARAEI